MIKRKKLAAILLLLVYAMALFPLSVFAVSETAEGVAVSEEYLDENQVTVEESETGTDEIEQEITETEIDPVFDESGYDFSDMAPDDCYYCDTEYDYSDSMIQYDDFDDNINEESFEPGYDFSDNITLFSTNTIIREYDEETTSLIELDLIETSGEGANRVTDYGEDFEFLANDAQLEAAVVNWLVPLENTKDQHFFTMQGSCFDGEYWYFAFTVNYWVESNNSYIQKGYMIIKVPQNNLENFLGIGTSITYFEGVELFHLNDMTYNTITEELVIAACVDKDHDAVYTINSEDLNTTRKISESQVGNVFKKHNVSCNVTSIAFSEKDGYYIVGLTGQLHLFAKLDYDFNLIETMGETSVNLQSVNPAYANKTEPWLRQTIFVDNNYIYNLLHLYDEEVKGDAKKANETENMIEIYDLKGKYKETVYFKVSGGTDRRYEAENLNIVDGRLIIGFNCAEGVTYRDFCYYDFTENGFSVTYCPDDNITAHIANVDLPASFVLRGFETKLFTNPFSENGKEFLGWNAYRKEVDKWFYVNADKVTGWYKEGEQPSGYTKYRYGNKAKVSRTGASGEHVYMCAQWADSNNFTVYFAAPDVTEDKYSQTITHGTPTALKSNTFEKADRNFKGWQAYWVETKQWLYVNTADGKTLKWCVAGSQPIGYEKYVYSNGENVSKTVHKGNQVIMYAVWDEFFIYYNPNGNASAAYQLLTRHRGHNVDDNTNLLKSYSINGFTGYNLYWREEDKWLYYNSSTRTLNWFKKGQQPSGYSLYLKPFNADGEAYLGSTVSYGENLVLYAVWS